MSRIFTVSRWLAIGLVLALFPITAAAHEQRDVGDGQYSLEIGFRDEPAYLSQPNALYLKVTQFGSAGGPVEGLAGTLEAEVQKDGATLPLTLVPGSERGVYEARFIPTALGDYTFRLFGDIEGTSIDESFSSSPTTFAPVEPLDRYQFPVSAPAGAELVAQLDAANARAARSETMAYVGIAAGVIGLLAGVDGLLRTGRSRPQVVTGTDHGQTPLPDQGDAAVGRALIRQSDTE
jgi:hypothetical protein